MRRLQIGSSVLLAAVVAFGTVAQAADQGVIYLARAIGEEAPPPESQTTPKTTPAKKPSTPQKPVTAAKPAPTAETPPTESKGISKTAIWIGVGVAALLAAAAAGGGGSSATSH